MAESHWGGMKSKLITTALACLVSLIILAVLTFVNYHVAVASPGGADFLTHWVGTRGLFHGESPYTQDVAVRVQTIFYGRPALPGENEFLAPYPIYTALIFAPFVLPSNYILARSLWMTFLEICIVVSFSLSFRVTDWKPKTVILGMLCFFFIFWYNSIRSLVNGNIVILDALLFIATLWAVKAKKDPLAGVLLTLSTIKPNLALLPGLLLLIWMAREKRWHFHTWFAISLTVLVVCGMLIVPDWPLQNLANILHYNSYTPPTTVGQALGSWWPEVGHPIGWAVSAVLIGLLAWEWYIASKGDFSHLLWTFTLTLVASQWIGISTDPGNFSIFILPLILVFFSIYKLSHGTIWLGLSLAILLIGLWFLFIKTLRPGLGGLQSPIMFFPLPIFLIGGLYLIRQQYVRVVSNQKGFTKKIRKTGLRYRL